MTVEFNTETIRLLTLFENITNVTVRDCFVNNDVIYFIVDEGKIGLAIGKNGNAIKNVEKVVGKKIKVYEYSSDPAKFVRNIIPQCKDVTIIDDGENIIAELKVDKRDRGLVIGREGEKIKIYKEILKRIHKISDIQVK